ncbi:hypothetical protein C7B76_25365 [filamentous cyanobacterium CCP2]|nr:hypothetical protein C7B76_25365 [filamentous cyanobacterium CCP2]
MWGTIEGFRFQSENDRSRDVVFLVIQVGDRPALVQQRGQNAHPTRNLGTEQAKGNGLISTA